MVEAVRGGQSDDRRSGWRAEHPLRDGALRDPASGGRDDVASDEAAVRVAAGWTSASFFRRALPRHRTTLYQNARRGPMEPIADQPTPKLRTNLRAQREHAATLSGWRRRSALRSIVEMEDELEARGEAPEPKPPKPKPASQPTGYYTQQRLKMHTVKTPPDDNPALSYHEDRGDGLPLCGQPLTSGPTRTASCGMSNGPHMVPGSWTAASARTIQTGMTGLSRLPSHRANRCVPCPAVGLRRTSVVEAPPVEHRGRPPRVRSALATGWAWIYAPGDAVVTERGDPTPATQKNSAQNAGDKR